MVDGGWSGKNTRCKIPYLLTTIYSLPATGSIVDSSEYMVDGGMVREEAQGGRFPIY
ncbi:hypothetical protein J7K43_01350 [Candidatus Calescamantes bacterium]|nr:hypothetical protein [Candidatus Calescamantes bacterium]